MKKTMILMAAATMLAATSSTIRAEEHKDASSEKAGGKKAKAYPLDKCIVSDEKLGEHGKPYVFTHEGQEIKLCCKDCLKDFKKEPAKYLKKLETPKASEKK